MTYKANVLPDKIWDNLDRRSLINADFYFQTVFSLKIVSRLSSCFCPNQPAVSHLFLLPSKYLQCGPCSIIVLERQIKKSFVLSFHCLPVLSLLFTDQVFFPLSSENAYMLLCIFLLIEKYWLSSSFSIAGPTALDEKEKNCKKNPFFEIQSYFKVKTHLQRGGDISWQVVFDPRTAVDYCWNVIFLFWWWVQMYN